MDISEIKNKHFKIVLDDLKKFIDNNQEPPEDLFFYFIEELKVSNLIIPGFWDGDDFHFEIVTSDDGSEWIFLFTDEIEYLKVYDENNVYKPSQNEFGLYVDLLNDRNLAGIVINVDNEDLSLGKDFINEINVPTGIIFNDNFRGYSPEQLKNTINNISNDSLIEYIRNEANVGNYDGLFFEFSKSLLINVVISDKNLERFSKDGIISAEDVGGFDLCTSFEDDGNYAIMFSSIDAIKKTMNVNSEFYFYSQITILSKLVDFVLYSDMEGIILNPGLDNVFIPRNVLLSKKPNLAMLDNPGFKNAIDYAFLF